MTRRAFASVLALAALSATTACDKILGLDKFTDVNPGEQRVCTPKDTSTEGCPAYSGKAGTEGVGICKASTKVCADDGMSWSTCKSEVTPKPMEDCTTPDDDDCNGLTNDKSEGCCTQGQTEKCYDPSVSQAMQDQGACMAGTLSCGAENRFATMCTGAGKPSAETCASTADDDCDGRECVEWNQNFGDVTDQYVSDVAVDASGNIYVVGSLYGSIISGNVSLIGKGSGDAYILKLDPSGSPLWGKSFGDNDVQSFDAVAVDSQGNVFVGGRSYTPINLGGMTLPDGLFVAKYASDGSHVWSEGLTSAMGCVGSDSNFNSVAVSPNGDPVIGGYFCGQINFGDGAIVSKGRDAFVAKLRGADGSGKVADGYWGLTFGDAALQEIVRVAVDSGGNIVAAGSFQGQIDFGEGAVTTTAGYDGIVIWFDPSGKPITYQRIGGFGGEQHVTDLALDALGAPVVSGTFDNEVEFNGVGIPATAMGTNGFVARYAADQSFAWSKTFPVGFLSVGVDSTNEVLLTGVYGAGFDLGDGVLMPPANGLGMVLAKLKSGGSVLWKRAFSAGTNPFVGFSKIRALQTGESIVAGMMADTMDFGAGPLTSNGGLDIFVAQFGL